MNMQPHDTQHRDLPDDADDTILRVVAALKPLPSADPRAVARVLSAVHGRTPQPTGWWRDFFDWMRVPSLSMAGATGLVLVALLAGYLTKGGMHVGGTTATNDVQSAVSANAIGDRGVQRNSAAAATRADAEHGDVEHGDPSIPVLPASAMADAERALPVQFVLDVPNAHTVSVVGDFNDWTVDQAPLQKFANGAWSITLPVKPGRHEYAFVIDGTRWMADPRAPKARDSDFGKPGSVIVVVKP